MVEDTAMETKVQVLQKEVICLEASVRCLSNQLCSIYGGGRTPDIPESAIGAEAPLASEEGAEPVPTIDTLEDCTNRVVNVAKWLIEVSAMV